MKALTYVEIDVPSFVPQSPDEVIQTFTFAVPTDYLAAEPGVIPSIDSVSITPATISLGKDLGQRASITITLNDHPYVFNGEPFDQGTFWGKWRGRYGTKLRGREVRIIRGFLGQARSEMDTRYYVIDTVDGPSMGGKYTIVAKDILKLADDDRAKAPFLSNGSLAGSIASGAGSLTLSPTGIGAEEYPASGWVCLGGKEVCSFTRSGDTLTITRGQFGTVAQDHDAGDRVQLVLRYTGDDVADIIYDLLTEYAGVPAEYIDLEQWQEETAEFLGVIYARTITEPTSVNKLISELVEQACLAVWWDDRAKQVRLQVLREIATDANTFDQSDFLAGSFSVKEQPNKRISEIWTYYGQRDPTDSGANEDNYRAVLASLDAVLAQQYGSAEIAAIQAAWVETETAATRLNSIQLSRYKNPPRAFTFDLMRDSQVSLATGYQVRWWGNQDETGVEVPALIQVTKISILPDRIHVEAEEMLASGVVVLVNVVFLTTTGSLLSWTVPDSWNDSDNSIECIGGGGGGGSHNGNGAPGGGGGAYAAITNLNLTPGASVSYNVGDGALGGADGATASGDDGGATWFNGATYVAASVAAAAGTAGGAGRTSIGIGGQASNSIGTTKFSGGNGGTGAPKGDARAGGGGGGGAAGPHGDGADGGSNTNIAEDGGAGGGGADGGFTGDDAFELTGGNGGNNRFNFGGGTSGQPNGDEGGGGRGGDNLNVGGTGGDGEQIWTQTVTPIISAGSGGGGGGGGSGVSGGAGGLYGGGGGGSGEDGAGGPGRQGIIVISWREA